MVPVHSELWQRILDFSIDGPEPPALSFAHRLARENGWPLPFADRAILEYKRFAFLAMTVGHPVCPSEQVDQVWHLHLTYTRSYWGRFCKEVLGKPLHHDPTKGGPSEAAKHVRMYDATLAGYREAFGCKPPADLWPSAAIRFGEDAQHRQVDTGKSWIVPKATVRRGFAKAALLIAGLGLTGCVGPVLAEGGIDGPTYLLLFVTAYAAVFALALVLRNKLRGPSDPIEVHNDELDCYDIALLAGGPRRVFDTAVLRSIEKGSIEVTADGKLRAIRLPYDSGSNSDPLSNAIELEILTRVSAGSGLPRPVLEVRKESKFNLDTNKDRLLERGLFLSNERAKLAAGLPYFITLIALIALGIPRLISGIQNNAPSCFLMFLTAAGFMAGLATFARKPRRTVRGDLYLNERIAHRPVSPALKGQLDTSLILSMALLGTAILAGTQHDALRKSLYPTGSDGSSSSGCGSSGCDSGSGCGGGGDGGGGGCGGGCGGGGD